ncbi:hypothetical protein MGP2080_14941 [marine gamma proteobacterium HTCC2080]|nr:hypothetical protein MGP2080_14941 [marine gamma proteobacterium HTCC2080]
MNNEMKVRTSNILIAVFWVLVAAVWVPILFHGMEVVTNHGYMRDLGLASRSRGASPIDTGGLLIWAAITGAVVAAQYLIAGTVRFKFQKQ